MKILITGLTGCLGSGFAHYLRNGLSKDDQVFAYCRNSSETNNIDDFASIIRGDGADFNRLNEVCNEYKFDMMIHIANKHRVYEYAELCVKNNIKKAIFVSSTYACSYKHTSEKNNLMLRIENNTSKLLKENNVEYIFFRPTSMFGARQNGVVDRNISKFTNWVLKLPFFPLFGGGKASVQPVWGLDAGNGLFLCYQNFEQFKNNAYICSGDQKRTFKELIKMIGEINNKKVRFLYVPGWLAICFYYFIFGLSFGKLDRRESIHRILENRAFETSPELIKAGYTPHSLKEALSTYIITK